MKKSLLSILLLCLLFSCCKFDEKPNTAETEPIYTPSVAWTLDTGAYKMMTRGEQFGRCFYISESNWYFKTESDPLNQKLAKIDLETGFYIWQTEIEEYEEKTYAVVWEDKVFVLYRNGIMRCYDDSNGDTLASIRFGETERESLDNACFTMRMLVYEKYMYWINFVQDFSRPWGVMRFDPSLIDFSLDPYEEQLIMPSLIWQNTEQGILVEPVLSEDGILYFNTYNSDFQNGFGFSLLGAIDCNAIDNNAALLWQRELNSSGLSRNCLYIKDDKIFVIDALLGCYNRNSGEPIYEHLQTLEDVKKEVGITSCSGLIGLFYDGGMIYYTGQNYFGSGSTMGIPEKYVKNIFCIDARNGKLVWADMPPGGGSLGTRPIVHNGKAYVITDCGLRVYNSKTGTLIGVDTSVINSGEDPNALWDGKIIYFHYDYTRRVAVLTAIYGN